MKNQTFPQGPEIRLGKAEALLSEITQGSGVPVIPGELNNSNSFQINGCLFLGAAAIPGRKSAGRWVVPEDAVRDAAAQLRDTLPPAGAASGPDLIESGSQRWRRSLAGRWEELQLPGPGPRPVLAFGCVDGVPLVRPEPEGLVMPRPYAELFDRLEAAQVEGRAALLECEGCGTLNRESPGWYTPITWRVPSRDGYRTLCPACHVRGAVQYAGEYAGVVYDRLRRKVSAVGFRCTLCPTRAIYWDHCHEHGLVRGPLCGACNQSVREQFAWAETPAGVRHLRACTGCTAA